MDSFFFFSLFFHFFFTSFSLLFHFFILFHFIFFSATGIDKVRAAIAEEEDEKSTKQRQRERTRPKMGKINVNYQELYDSFFVTLKKPMLSLHGDM